MPVLVPDASVSLPAVTVIKASAGSGKTYTLTQRYVQFALSREIPRNDPRNILAITFSNNASREMKENVLAWLKLLAFGDKKRMADIAEVTAGGEDFIRRRAAALVDEILRRFTDFQVRTIDSFMSMVFRASALDLGFSPDFEIVMDPAPLLDYSFELFLREAREGSERARYLDETIRSVLGLQGEGDRFPWDPSAPLLAEMKRIEGTLSALETEARPVDLERRIREVQTEIRRTLERTRNLIESSGLEENQKSTFPKALAAAEAGRFAELIDRGMKTAPVKKPAAKAAAKTADAYERIKEDWEMADALVSRYASLWARSFYGPYLRLRAEIGATVERVKRNQGKIFLGDVSRGLGEYLSSDIVPDVYFRIGEKVFHFLIDEFQDTSPLQWRNLFPLVENSLAEGGSLFAVGDTKQAIYGFRRADYAIMKSLEAANPFPSSRHEVKELEVNYRSRPRILEFVERVFKRNAPALPEYREAVNASGLDSYAALAEKGDDPGYVALEILPRDDDDPPERAKLQSVVEELHERGYRWGDIAILAPRNDDVLRATSWLNEKGIPFISFSSLDVRRRRIAGEIVCLLRFLDSPPDDLSFASFILGDIFSRVLVRKHGWKSTAPLQSLLFAHRAGGARGPAAPQRDATQPNGAAPQQAAAAQQERAKRALYKAFQETFPDLWKTYFSGLFRSAGYLPLYDLASEVFAVFGVFEMAGEEEATLAKLLEAVKDFEGSGSNSLREFLASAADAAAEGDKWKIEVPRTADSVRAMTIHKAKGLGFPAVVVLLYGERNRGFEYTTLRDEEGVTLVKLNKAVAGRDPELAELYERESTKEKVNRLNGLYVALTRAKAEMYVIGVKREKDSYPFDLLPAEGFAPSSTKGPARGDGAAARSSAPLRFDARPVPSSPGASRIAREERRRGEIVHRILSLIDFLGDDLEERVARAAERTMREARERDLEPGLVKAVSGLIKSAPLSEYFTRRAGRLVFTEKELCDGSGRLFRTDRIVVDAERVTVLDYKTGGEEREGADAAYDEQMRTYARILGRIYPGRRIEALLVFTDRGAVRSVK